VGLGKFRLFQQEATNSTRVHLCLGGELVTETSQHHLFCLFSSWVNVPFFTLRSKHITFLLGNLPLSFGYTASVSLTTASFCDWYDSLL
jgi:hypothetical protein